MKHIIIGTAGHIDHGKTSLVKALTGRDTDTLKEEKERGISINLGFTFFDLPSGKRCGIVDVPGHEKFIKNMLAGVSGIDLVLMVIAAEEGIMPQTREHFEILQLLNVKKGIIVITKKDLVEEEMLKLVVEDIRDYFKGTFLEKSPIVAVSSRTKAGIDTLVSEIDKAVEVIEEKDMQRIFRLPVDRVFSVSGFGTVVTGTIIGGNIRIGDSVEIYPSGSLGKIRGIQVHDRDTESAEAGERCALNISGVKVEDISRGCVISLPNKLEPSTVIDCSFSYLSSADKTLINRQRVRVYHGTEELFGRVVLLDKEELKPGDNGFIQIMLEKPITALNGDRFVVRNYSPMITIGGGMVIIANSRKKKRFQLEVIKDLQERSEGRTENLLEKTIETLSSSFPDISTLSKAIGRTEEAISLDKERLYDKGVIYKIVLSDREHYVHSKYVEEIKAKTEKVLADYHKNNPLKQGISKEELKNKVFNAGIKQKLFDGILTILNNYKLIKLSGSFVSLYNFQIVYDRISQQMAEKILAYYSSSGFNPQRYEELLDKERDRIAFARVFNSLLENGELTKLAEGIILHGKLVNEARENIRNYIQKQGSITVGEARDLLGISRKYAVALLEYFDQTKITRRVEDKRLLY